MKLTYRPKVYSLKVTAFGDVALYQAEINIKDHQLFCSGTNDKKNN